MRGLKSLTAEGIANRLTDYGFHAPTLSWPVAGTPIVEPTESEPQYELGRFCDVMISIHAELTALNTGTDDSKNNSLKSFPNNVDQITGDAWNRPYTHEAMAFPVKSLHDDKSWPHVARMDDVFGDRNAAYLSVRLDIFRN